jgi:hypothetical protein
MRSRSIPILALATMLVACSDVSTSEPQLIRASLQPFDTCIDCAPTSFTLYPTSDIHLGGSPVLAFVINAGSVGGKLPSNVSATVGLVAPSDTIPAPAPPGPVQEIWARAGATPFRAILQSYAAAGLVAPSDTIPGPPAPGKGSVKQLSNGDVLVWVSTSYLQQRGLSTNIQALTLTLSAGKTTLFYGSAPVEVFTK